MRTIDIDDAKTQLWSLVDAVVKGEKIVIAKAGTPVAMLVPVPVAVPVTDPQPVRKPGTMKGMISIAADFDAPLPEALQSAFDGRGS